jgi:hypothetical protein
MDVISTSAVSVADSVTVVAVVVGVSATISFAVVVAAMIVSAEGALGFANGADVVAVVLVAVEVDSDVEVLVSAVGTVTCVEGDVSFFSAAAGKKYSALSVESNRVSEETSVVAARVPHPDNRNIVRIKPISILCWRMDHPSRSY